MKFRNLQLKFRLPVTRFYAKAEGDEGVGGKDADGAAGDAGGETDSTADGQEKPTKQDGRFMTQAEIDGIIEARLKREREASDRKIKAEREKDEAKKLADAQEFKALSEKLDSKVKELEAQVERNQTEQETVGAQLDRYKQVIGVQVAALLKNVPDAVRELLEDRDPADQLDYLARNAEAFGGTKSVPGTPPAGGKGGDGKSQVKEDEARKQMARNYARSF
jgi:hypothetical protein